jgi:RNA polymerase sigma-70 factor (ECF subfamily)
MIDLDEHLPQIVAGDSRAFARWIAGAEAPMRGALRRFAAVVDVEAVLQEALLRTWQVAPRLEQDGRPNGLLRSALRIARNLALDLARRHRADPTVLVELDDESSPAVAPELPDPFLRELIAECKGKLPHQPAVALGLRLASAGGEPDATLAKRCRMQLNTFLQNVTRARRLLADCLRQKGASLETEMA